MFDYARSDRHTRMWPHTHEARLCCRHKKLCRGNAGFLQRVRVECKLQLLADRGPWWISMHSVFTHTPAPPTKGRRRCRAAESTQPFCSTSRNSPSLSALSVWWGGAIKWICCYFPRLFAEDVKPQPVRQPRMTAYSGRGKHTHTRTHACRHHHSATLMISFHASV